MLMKTAIILFLMLIAFSVGDEGLTESKASKVWHPRIPQRSRSKNVSFISFILNGTPADIADYPFKLSMRFHGEFFCGASVIGPNWALTAAHCFEYGFPPDTITLYGGTSNRLTGGVEFEVESYQIHPDYDFYIMDYDVAVIKIKDTFEGHPGIRRSILANERCTTSCGVRVRLAGWGYNEDWIIPEELQEIQQTIVDNESCYEAWGGDITSRMLCATVENNVDSCNGDSGGAVLKGCLQVGIISFGSIECGYPIPSVFTRIEDPAIRNFIRSETGI